MCCRLGSTDTPLLDFGTYRYWEVQTHRYWTLVYTGTGKYGHTATGLWYIPLLGSTDTPLLDFGTYRYWEVRTHRYWEVWTYRYWEVQTHRYWEVWTYRYWEVQTHCYWTLVHTGTGKYRHTATGLWYIPVLGSTDIPLLDFGSGRSGYFGKHSQMCLQQNFWLIWWIQQSQSRRTICS